MGLKRRVRLPGGKAIDIHYNKKVYSPHYSSVDTIVLANFLAKDGDRVIDVSCGSGITGLSLKYLKPGVEVTLCDIDENAVKMADENANRLALDVEVFKSDLLPKDEKWDIIIANLPTYTEEDMKQDLHGPKVSYFADKTDGLSLYRRLLEQAKTRLTPSGCIVCEVQSKLQRDFVDMAYNKGYKVALKNEYGFVLSR